MNSNNISKIGTAFVVLYTAATVYAIYYASTCGSGLCGLAGVIPLTPWPQLFEGLLDLNLPKALLPIFFFMNAVILYYIGKAVSILLAKF